MTASGLLTVEGVAEVGVLHHEAWQPADTNVWSGERNDAMTRIPLLVLHSLHLHEYAGVVLVSKALIGTHAPEPADAKAKQVCIGSYRYTYVYMHYTNDASVSIKNTTPAH